MRPAGIDENLLLRATFVAQVEHYATVGSTNDVARQRAVRGPGPLPLLIVADEQTAGRGRGANRWWTGPGSLAFSLLMDPSPGTADSAQAVRRRWPLVSLAAAVAVVRTVAPRLAGFTVGLHWPNDVFAEGRKLAGILAEGLPDGRLILGIGLNANNTLGDAPPSVRDKATTMLELTGASHDRNRLLHDLLCHLAKTIGEAASRPEHLAAQAHGHCLQRGGTLVIESGRDLVRGRCVGIDFDGGLLLDTAEGRRKLYSGVLREATASGASSSGSASTARWKRRSS
jgi:BirA family biotin operon repressor/biotin-[acetyl-CoA-carboxylase] ligase